MAIAEEKDFILVCPTKDLGIGEVQALYEGGNREEAYKYYSFLEQVDLSQAKTEVDQLHEHAKWETIKTRRSLDTSLPEITEKIMNFIKEGQETDAIAEIQNNLGITIQEAHYIFIKILRKHPEYRRF